MSLNATDLEALFEELAETLDRLDPARHSLYLAKLTLLLAERVGDADAIRKAMETARLQLDGGD